jgi:outer membrane biosynthesis protein TonB
VPVEQDEKADAPAAPTTNAPTAPAADASPAPAAAPQPVITTLVTRNVSNADQVAPTPAAPESAQPPAAPSSPPPTVATEASPLPPEQATSDRQAPTVIAQRPAAQATSTPAVPPLLETQAANTSTQTMPTLQLLLGAVALLGFLASAAFFVMAVMRRRRDVLHIRRPADALPFEESPDMAATTDGPTFHPMPPLDPIRRHDDVDEALRRIARRRRATAAP